jgi:hypothetical protein
MEQVVEELGDSFRIREEAVRLRQIAAPDWEPADSLRAK